MPGMKQRVKERLSLFLLRHSRFFDARFYREQAGLPEGTDAAAHYLRGGWREHDPSPEFRQEGYLAANEDVRRADVCPLAHWLLYGKRQHVRLYPGYVENHYHAYRLPRAAARIFYRTLYAGMIRRNRDAKILAAVHVHYPESVGELTEFLKNLRPYACDLAVTATEGAAAEAAREMIPKAFPEAEIRTVPNRGLDIGPLLDTLEDRDPDGYRLIVKIQAKACDPKGGCYAEGRRWYGRERFLYGMRAVLGARQVHRNIDRLLRRDDTDLIAAKALLLRDTPRKEQLTADFLAPFGLSLPSGYTFVSGGCWMMKAERGRALRQLPVSAADLLAPVRGAFSAVSALERYLTGTIPAERQHGNPVRGFRALRGRGNGSAGAPEAGRTDTGRGGPVIAFAVTETGEQAVAGDYFTAKELAEALEKRGWRTKFLSRKEPGDAWYRAGRDTDVVVSMLEDYDPQHIWDDQHGLVTVGWARNWFDRWAESPGTGLYDILLASSETACRTLSERTGKPVELLPIAANAERFRAAETEAAVPAYQCDVCLAGNRFGKREIEDQLDPEALGAKLRILGTGWEKVKALAPYCGGHLPYAEMPKVYRSTKIVLDDATASTQESGSVNSRVYDALAAGCLVLTNNARGAEETFEGRLPVFRSREELTDLVRHYLADGEARQAKVEELRAFVLERHTYAIRAEQLEKILRERRAI